MNRRMSGSSSSVLGGLSLLGLLVSVADGHHSRTEYDQNSTTEITGEILSVRWQNPHIELRLRTADDDGNAEEWYLEGQSAVRMNAAGASPDLLQPGMQVRVAGGASTRRPHRMEFTNLLLPDGVEIVSRPNVLARWSDRVIGTSGSAVARASALPDDGPGIFRVWSLEPSAPGVDRVFWQLRAPSEFSLTERAQATAAGWNEDDPNDNLLLQCVPPGMPSTMGNPQPIEFVDMGNVIEIRSQEMDVVRTIHLAPSDLATVESSPFGYSVGRWEGDTLVVETTRLNAPYFNRRGVPQSESARVLERFQVDAEQGRLTDVLTFTDPEYLTEPFVTELRWIWDENATVQRFDCQVTE